MNLKYIFGGRKADKAKIAELTERVRIQKFGIQSLQEENARYLKELESFDDFLSFLNANVPDFEAYVLAHMALRKSE